MDIVVVFINLYHFENLRLIDWLIETIIATVFVHCGVCLQPAFENILSKLSSGSWTERHDGLVVLQTQLQCQRRLSYVSYS